MIALFSMLFGAGIVLNADRISAAASRLRAASIHYRRMFWLLIIGLIHAYGLWYGDILNTYAICGALLYPLRRLRPGLLIGLGILVITISIWARIGPRMYETTFPRDVTSPTAQVDASKPESTQDRIWRESTENETKAYRGSYLDLFRWRANLNTVWHFYGGINYNFWRCGGFIILGMGLAGILSATNRPSAFYWGLMIAGYSTGLLLAAEGFWPQLTRALGRTTEMSPDARRNLGLIAWSLRQFGALSIALGHTGLIILLSRALPLRTLLTPLAAAGQMALSNYLLQTLIAITIFDGYTLARWGTWSISQIETMVVITWIAQLILSPLYLRYFRFGPMEWLWRSLTYWKLQPFRRRAATAPLNP